MVNSTREEAATYAADGYAREKGLGAVAVTYGVGMVATMAALGGANSEGVAVVVIGGAPGMGERDGRRIHHAVADDMEAPRAMAREITAHSILLDDPDTAFDQIDWILDACRADIRPVFIELPRDMISAVPERVERRPAQLHVPPPPPERIDAAARDLVQHNRVRPAPGDVGGKRSAASPSG